MNEEIIRQFTAAHPVVSTLVVLAGCVAAGKFLSRLLDLRPITVRVHPLKPRKLPFFWEEFDDLDEGTAADVRRRELSNVVDISSRRAS